MVSLPYCNCGIGAMRGNPVFGMLLQLKGPTWCLCKVQSVAICDDCDCRKMYVR